MYDYEAWGGGGGELSPYLLKWPNIEADEAEFYPSTGLAQASSN